MTKNEIGMFGKKHEQRLLYHVDAEEILLLDSCEPVRRFNPLTPNDYKDVTQ
jgi:hypothetical protein